MNVPSKDSKSFHFPKAISLSVVMESGTQPSNIDASASFTTFVVRFGSRASFRSLLYFSTQTKRTHELCLETMKSISQCPYEYREESGLVSIHFLLGSERNILFSLFLPPL